MNTPSTPVTGNIYLALAAILRDMDAVAKERKNEAQGFKFRGIEDVYNALHPIFAAHGVTCIPIIEKVDLSEYTNTKGNKVFRSLVTAGYRFMASDGSYVDSKTVGEGMDHGDKATPKALSMAHKYVLFQTFLIPTADLMDADFYEPTVDPRGELADRERRKALEAIIAEKREMALHAATDEERKRLQGEAADMQAELDNERGAQLEQERTGQLGTDTFTTATKAEESDWKKIVCHIGTETGPVKGKTLGKIFAEGDINKAAKLMDGPFKKFMTGVRTVIEGHEAKKHGPPEEADLLLYRGLQKAGLHLNERIDKAK